MYKNKYSIFVSYRRDGGDFLAQLICDRLSQKKYGVFHDVEALRNGDFCDDLYDAIDNCKDFVLVLPPHGLDRAVTDPENDWVKKEIIRAFEKKKNIIPVKMRDFAFPDGLPETLERLKNIPAVEADMVWFDEVIERIVGRLSSQPVNLQVYKNKSAFDHNQSIKSVYSMASNRPSRYNKLFSRRINTDKHKIMTFSCDFRKRTKSKNVVLTAKIYDPQFRCISASDHSVKIRSLLPLKRLMFYYGVRGDDGSCLTPGLYLASFSIDGSPEYYYQFIVAKNKKDDVENLLSGDIRKFLKHEKAKLRMVNFFTMFLWSAPLVLIAWIVSIGQFYDFLNFIKYIFRIGA